MSTVPVPCTEEQFIVAHAIALLTITAAAREHLPARAAYAKALRMRLESDVDAIMRGLE